uniref:SET domain-containing protein n=1 Tax=viral metagenome TaxID=1070528 RepID=A0A6C0CYR4_9ZZZZ
MSIVNCSNVYVKDVDDVKGLGVFAKVNISCGDIVEMGVARRVETDGNNNHLLFT